MNGLQDVIDAALAFDDGIISKRVDKVSTINIDVPFNGEFIIPPNVTVKLLTAIAYNGRDMSVYLTISATSVTRTGFILTITNLHTSNEYYADCTIEWTAETSE